MSKLSDDFDCFLYDCLNRSIESHSISKSRVFSVISKDKTEKLLMLEDKYSSDFAKGKMSSFQARNRSLISVSKESASIFKGFCSICDSTLFNELDKYPYKNNPKINFLHVLRAYSYKLRNERKMLQLISSEIPQIGNEDLNQSKLNLFTGLPKLLLFFGNKYLQC